MEVHEWDMSGNLRPVPTELGESVDRLGHAIICGYSLELFQ